MAGQRPALPALLASEGCLGGKDPAYGRPRRGGLSSLGNTAFPRLGWSLDLSGNELFAGSPGDATFASSAGAAYYFQLEGGEWKQLSKFFGSDPGAGGFFGWSLQRTSDTLVVGAPASTTPTPGRVHTFSADGAAQMSGTLVSLSNTAGGVQWLTLGTCAKHAGDFYLVLGSFSGTSPALGLGTSSLPLVPDAYTLFTFNNPNGPLLPGSLGLLDAWGRAVGAFVLPPGTPQGTVGLTLHHAYLVLDAQTLAVELASNAVPVTIVP